MEWTGLRPSYFDGVVGVYPTHGYFEWASWRLDSRSRDIGQNDGPPLPLLTGTSSSQFREHNRPLPHTVNYLDLASESQGEDCSFHVSAQNIFRINNFKFLCIGRVKLPYYLFFLVGLYLLPG